MAFPRRSADGLYHRSSERNFRSFSHSGKLRTVSNDVKKPKEKRSREEAWLPTTNFGWSECCDHCPYPDCDRVTVCLSVITYDEFVRFTEIAKKILEGCGNVLAFEQKVGVRYDMAYDFINRRKYPTRRSQRSIKAFLENYKENESNDDTK